MTEPERMALRRRIDEAVRARGRVGKYQKYCRGCGQDQDYQTPGCMQCNQRHKNRRYRERNQSRVG